MSNSYMQLSLAMFRTGVLGFGGGPSVIPLFRHEAVSRYKWLDDDEFGDTLAIANTLPGPIAVKMAAYFGYINRGWLGALVSTCVHILPTCLAMVFLASFIQLISHSEVFLNMIGAVIPVVCVMLSQMVYEFGQKAVKGLGIILAIVFFVVSLLLLQIVTLHPGIVIIIFLAYGAFHFKLKKKLNKKEAARS